MNEEKNTIDRKLDELRAEIDSVDVQLTALLDRRFSLTREIGKAKGEIGRQIKDEAREQIVLDRVARNLGESENSDSVKRLFKLLMQLSVEQQSSGLEEFEAEARARAEAKQDLAYPQVCIIGAGLIGGALARKIKAVYPDTQISAIDLPLVLPELEASAIFASCRSNIDEKTISPAKLIVIACPPDVSLSVMKALAPRLHAGQLVIDLCSVKQAICDLAARLELNGAEFIGVHPFFGTEKSGFEHSAAVPLKGKTVCLVSTKKSSSLTLNRLRTYFSNMEFCVFDTDAGSHDATVAATSHIIQLMATALGSVIYDEIISTGKSDHLVLSGGALAGLARLMASRPGLWLQIVNQNKIEVEQIKQKVLARLSELIEFSHTDREKFEQLFEHAAQVSLILSN